MSRNLSLFVRASLLILMVAGAFPACSSSGPHLVLPLPEAGDYTELRLVSVNATSTSHVFVAGFLVRKDGVPEACLLTTRNAGKTWRRVGADLYDFVGFVPQDIHFNDRLRGWVSGVRVIDGATIPVVIRTDDGGGHWSENYLAQDRSSIVLGARDLTFESDDLGRVSISYVSGEGNTELVNVFSTKDSGRNWVLAELLDEIPPPRDTAERMVSADQGFRLRGADAEGTFHIVFTADGGTHWVPFSSFHLSDLLSWY